MPPSTPPERAAAIRRAFVATMRDPGFLDEAGAAARRRPLSGDDMARIVAQSFAVPPPVLAIAKTAME